MQRAVKYCGGCNSRYDRRALVKKLENRLNQTLPAAQPDIAYDEIYVICGCASCCADVSALQAEKIYFLWMTEDGSCRQYNTCLND